uniref:NADH dehydrogenase subunit 5 n=1 Tax=Heterophrynus longicornis TaxID=1046789 RepID=UPI00241196FA|nr:NADH dehydrogenase subunit 5 [Heterophrynus longicornis]WEM34677.1 NADH dehydrogenase subunit 5 [Heterophrynus longicornis]
MGMGRVGVVFIIIFMMLAILGMEMLSSGWGLDIEYQMGWLWGEGIGVGFLMDWISVLFYSVVMMISGFVMFYSIGYMEGEKDVSRFTYLMVGFVLSMGLVVFSSNLVLLLFGWDGLGLVSYCLVIFYQNSKSYNAGMLTILMNRVGDVGLIGGIGVMFGLGFLSHQYYSLAESGVYLFLAILLLLASATSSAQIPFSAWLPAAMAAPTPVSSLVHSSTLVAAGVFLMVRLSGSMGCTLSQVLFFVGLVTMFMAGVAANLESDLKSIVALSTLSQLGLMMMVVSLGWWEMAYFHMVIHALFSAMMFMCAGSIIHSSLGDQDVRSMSGVVVYTPLVGVTVGISSMALMGFPFLAGFYSSDLILESLLGEGVSMVVMILVVVSFMMTVGYSVRLVGFTMWGGEGWKSQVMSGEMEESYMGYAILGMVGFSVIGGALVVWLFFPLGGYFSLGIWEKSLGLWIVLGGLWFQIIFEGWWSQNLMELSVLGAHFFGGMWFMGWLSGNPVVSGLWLGSYFGWGDVVWGEIVGPKGLGEGIVLGSSVSEVFMSAEDSGFYLVVVMMGVFLLMVLV